MDLKKYRPIAIGALIGFCGYFLVGALVLLGFLAQIRVLASLVVLLFYPATFITQTKLSSVNLFFNLFLFMLLGAIIAYIISKNKKII